MELENQHYVIKKDNPYTGSTLYAICGTFRKTSSIPIEEDRKDLLRVYGAKRMLFMASDGRIDYFNDNGDSDTASPEEEREFLKYYLGKYE